ncbi:Nitroreductase [Caloramator quimbayensis]|uniref:Nitroreductase n=1 Tax=Caloramator quimbayensis TaxID=1147123 RepID=A0A1T4YDK8_9CLOT|nr:nitroreductase family protein [Caloramator quimbayensis]SKA99628.1 Nitroreductase [Caloramator quimbayensis]
MDYFDIVKKRCSIRAFKSDEIEEEKLSKILEAARLAPTAANKQAFKILVIKTKGREAELKRIYNRDWFVEAPIILGICSIPSKAWVRADGKNYGDIDAAIVMDHIVLAATNLNLGTCWVGAFDVKAAREVLKLDISLEIVAFTPVGYAKEHNYNKIRKDIDELVLYL